jgi:hypothetical protein
MQSSFREGPSPAGSGEGPTKALFIRRLERLVRLRREYSEDLNPLGLRLLDRAISSTYKDLLEFGAEDEIKPIVARHPVPGWDADIG